MKKFVLAAMAMVASVSVSFAQEMVRIPGKDFEMSKTEVTQELYASVMGENPSYHRLDNVALDNSERRALGKSTMKNPVDMVSWYDAIMFCNLLSEKEGLTPVYAVDGKTDTTKWNYTPHKTNEIRGSVTQNTSATGYRLPTVDEWQYAARGGQNYKYAGSNNLDEEAWYRGNSKVNGNYITHPVGEKKANGYGLYDMSGNVSEWCWDLYYKDFDGDDWSGIYAYYCGGGYIDDNFAFNCEVRGRIFAYNPAFGLGFRVVRSATR